MNQVKELAIDFAAAIVHLAIEMDADATTVFNGLSIATGAMLADHISKEDGTYDEMSLAYAVTNFKAGLDNAVKFSVDALAEVSN